MIAEAHAADAAHLRDVHDPLGPFVLLFARIGVGPAGPSLHGFNDVGHLAGVGTRP